MVQQLQVDLYHAVCVCFFPPLTRPDLWFPPSFILLLFLSSAVIRAASAAGVAGTKLAASPMTTVGTTGGAVTGSGGKTAAAARAAPKLSQLSAQEMEKLFEDFAVKFEKSYKDDDEKAMRFQIFKRNLKRIDEVGRQAGRQAAGALPCGAVRCGETLLRCIALLQIMP